MRAYCRRAPPIYLEPGEIEFILDSWDARKPAKWIRDQLAERGIDVPEYKINQEVGKARKAGDPRAHYRLENTNANYVRAA